MYNEELKRQYIAEKVAAVSISPTYLESRFQEVGKMESLLEKDLAYFTTQEILEYYKTQNYTSFNIINLLNSIFNMYTQWCLQKNLVPDNQNHYLEMTSELLISCLNKRLQQSKYLTREQVLNYIKELPNPKDQFMLLGIYEFGKQENFYNICYAQMKHINEKEGIMRLPTGEIVEISKELIRYAKESQEADVYYSITEKEKKTMSLVDEGYIIKDYPNVRPDSTEWQKGRRIYRAVDRNLDYLGLSHVSSNNWVENGKINYIKSKMELYGYDNAEDYLRNHTDEFLNQYQIKTFCRARYLAKISDFL